MGWGGVIIITTIISSSLSSRFVNQLLYKVLLFQYTAGFLGSGDETTAKELMYIICATKATSRPLPGFESPSTDMQDRLSLGVDCDEVYPNIYIGDA